LYARLLDPTTDLQALFEQRYQDEYFVDVLPSGSHPKTNHVKGSNRCQLAVFHPQGGDQVVVLSVIDNLVKGAAGQAVQNMNLMLGLTEHQGLNLVGLYP
jgi:N-acetyl-gamma-glutamyl-phosphate reductase